MTDTTSTPAYPQDTVRITASYRVTTDDLVIAGIPETVEIELNDDAAPADPQERAVFLRTLIETLFRANPTTLAVDGTEVTAVPDLAAAAAGEGRTR